MIRHPRVLLALSTCAAVLAAAAVTPAAPVAEPAASDRVLEVLVATQAYDEHMPWRLSRPGSRAGYAIVVGPGRLLTTEDLVRQNTLVEVRRPGRSAKFTATVARADPQVNAALLTVDDPLLLKHLEPVALATNVARDMQTRIVQYDDSGARQEGEGRIVEISVEGLPAAPAAVLTCRVLSDLRVLNTGAPVFVGNRLAGLMMRYDAQRQSGFVLPAPILARFLLAAAAQPAYEGPPYAGFSWLALVDPVKRRYFGVPETGGGIQVLQTMPGSGAAGWLQPNDVILNWDGFALDNQGFYADPDYGRLRLNHAIGGRRAVGDTVQVDLVRSGKTDTVAVPLKAFRDAAALIPENTVGAQPDYLVEDGLVLRELTATYLHTGGRGWAYAHPRLVHLYLTRATRPEQPGDRVVIVAGVLPDPINIGYQDVHDEIVTAVNGKPIRNLADVFRIVDRDSGISRLTLQGIGVDLALDTTQRATANARIARAYRIPELRRQTTAAPR